MRYILIGALTIFITASFFLRFTNHNPFSSSKPDHYFKVGETTIKVDLATTENTHQKGLSGRNKLASDEGMYFLFGEPQKRTIWMKDMNFAIDVIWLRNGGVVELSENIVPLDNGNPIITSKDSVDAFLEVNAGFIQLNKLKVGDLAEGLN